MEERSFVTPLHTSTRRDYIGRVTAADKAECATVAKQFGMDYWDGDRRYGYGGYRYDGRWASVAEAMITAYELKDDARILDVGCGKAYLLYELKKLLPGAQVAGLDISSYAITHAKPEIKPYLREGHAKALPFEDRAFDLVISLGTLHNLPIFQLKPALQEIQRVQAGQAYIMVEAYRNEREKVNLLYWQLTCESFFHVDEWRWLFKEYGYTGDYEFIFFE